jgi:hypothetical protein
MPEEALVELARSTASAASVREGQIVEDQELTGTQTDLGPDALGIEPAVLEERQLVGQGGEFGAAKEPWLCAHAW